MFADVDAIVDADGAVAGVQAGRKDRRSAGHVSGGHLYRDRKPCGNLRCHGSVRNHQGRVAGGMQVLAAHLSEGTAFRVARAVEAGQK